VSIQGRGSLLSSRANIRRAKQITGEEFKDLLQDNMADLVLGRALVTVYKEKRRNAYTMRLSGSDNLKKLFHFFYDGVDESMFLKRKHDAFVRGLRLRNDDSESGGTLL
jgi:hypothetical protein